MNTANNEIVEILSGTPGKAGRYMDNVYDAKTGKYRGLVFSEKQKENDKEIERLLKIVHPDKKLEDVARKIAIIDTGVLSNHPGIQPYLVNSVDFTGEGLEDLNGHGTMVALLARGNSLVIKLLNVKALNAWGRGTEENLVKAIEWSVENGANHISISAGIYRKKWGLFECPGDCKVCRAAERAAEMEILVTVAAGNEAGKTYCPGKVGVLKKNIGVFTVSAADIEGKPLANTGYGSYAAVGEVLFGPLPPDADADRVPYLIELGNLLIAKRRYVDAKAAFLSALEIAEQYASPQQEIEILLQLGSLALQQNEYEHSIEYYNAVILTASTLGELGAEAKAWYQLGLIAHKLLDFTTAEYCYHKNLAITEQIGDTVQAAITCNELALIVKRTNERLMEANLWFLQALGYENLPPKYESLIRYNLAAFFFDIWKKFQFAPLLHQAQESAELALVLQETDLNSDTWRTLGLLADIADIEKQTTLSRNYRRREHQCFEVFEENRGYIIQEYGLLIENIAAATLGNTEARTAVEAEFPEMASERGWDKTPEIICRIWSGERNLRTLTQGLGAQQTLLIKLVLENID